MAPSYVYSSGSGELVVAVVPESYSWLWFRLPWKPPPNVFLAVDVVVTGTVVVAVVVIGVIVDSIVLLVSAVVVAVATDAIVAVTDVVAIVAAVVVNVAMLVVVDEATSMVLSTSEWLFSISLSLSLYNLKNKHNIIE